MRYLTLMLLLGGVLAAQTPNWRPPNLQQYFKQFKLPAPKPGAIEVAKPAPKVVLSPGQPCAIALVNALKKDPTNDHMVVHVEPPAGTTFAIVSPPAPSCDDVR